MNLHHLLSELSQQGVQLWVEDEKLRLRSPNGVLTTEQRSSITELKQDILELLRQNNSNSEANVPSKIVPAFKQSYQPFPLSDMQQAYWVGRSEMLELGIEAHFYFEIETSNFDLHRFTLIWRKLIERHEMLRAIILPNGEQQILEQVPLYEVEVLDLRQFEPETIVTQLQAVQDEMSHHQQLTDQWPLFEIRASLFNDQQVRLHFRFSLLITDGLSYQILMRELGELYYNPQAILPFLELSVRDYVLAKANEQKSSKYEQDLKYWLNRISSLPPAPELPLAKAPSLVKQYKFANLKAQLEPELWLRLKSRISQMGLTPFITLFTSYAEILTVWSKTPHFTITILYFNRLSLHPQVNDIVGNFSSTVLLEVDNTLQDTFAAKAKRLHQQLLQDLEHDLVSGVQVMRELNRFQGEILKAAMPVAFSCAIFPKSALERETSTSFWENNQIVYSYLQTPQVFLDCGVWEENGSLVVNLSFVKEVFPEDMVEEMFDAYMSFLKRLAFDEEAWQEISPQLLPIKQLQQLASIKNAIATPLEKKLLHTLFIEQVSVQPKHPAVISSTCTLTYEDLYQRSHRLGYQLRQLGARPQHLVAVVMEKGWQQVVGVLAILMAGSAYVPIDPALPQERRWLLLEQSDVQLVLTQSWLDETLVWPEGVKRICVDTSGTENAEIPIPILEPVQEVEDLAYVIYTSGSTGLPKGVMIDHQGAVNTIIDINQRFNVGSDDKVLALSSLNFDLSVYDIFGTLAAGGTIVFPDASCTKEPAHWLDLILQHEITIWNSVPALMQLLVESAASKQILPSSLRLVLLSGDWLPLTLPSLLKSLVADIEVISLGGATEASIWSVLYPIETVDNDWQSIPYGRPMLNQQLYVLNQSLQCCPVWVTGQLYIGGVGLAKGYWKNEEKTHASFITHPRTGERLYRTGDLGRYLPDGNIEFLGREDFQVKIQGYRIECGEIEAALLQHPNIKAVIVTAVGEQQGEKRLVAYVVPNVEPAPTPLELNDFLEQKVPKYMLPSIFMLMSALPLTPNGKVDRRSLPMPDISDLTDKASLVLPRDIIELQLTKIWSEILDVQRIGVKDNFFALGGYSFAAMRLMARIQKQFGKNLPLTTLLQSPTIEHLASHLRSSTDSQTSSPLVPIQPIGKQPPFFCIHPVGGNVLCYRDLARYLGVEQPFYALQALGLSGEQKPLTRIEDMAAHYIEALQTIQPQGPYYLGGWSLGGIIAFEMAQQLHQQGHEVALLALIDSYMPTVVNKSEAIDDAMLVASIAQDLGGIFGQNLSVSVEQLRQFNPEEQLNYLLEKAKKLNILPPEIGQQQMHQMLAVFKANNQAMYSYVPQIYPGKVTLLCASEQLVESNQSSSWSKLAAGGIEVNQIEGNHYTIVQEPQVQVLAQRLGVCISEAGKIGLIAN